MAKLGLFLATVALALFLANASIYRTSVTVDENLGWSTSRESSCEEEIEKRYKVWQCQLYLKEKAESPFRYKYNPRSESRRLNSCCEQLEELDRKCRCQGLEQAAKQQLKEGQFDQQEQKEMFRVAEGILSKCQMEPRECDMPSGPYRKWF
ncbi:hypothetical protein COLO4_09580 [Corchorus olitorius]|uniref:Bifunctional inhibitor/plant lipid transfer protein/seed storage helical domain-containing protein n=1 Tax=Corchorus olitorius TaxID=93759 RepID=A0A1R3KBP1_9ROSI|nr:hypothetical protein COLO4_09580 [Corchorus olitorius]